MGSGNSITRQLGQYAVGITLAGLAFWWVLSGIDLNAVWADLKRASLGLLTLSIVVNMCQNIFRCLRWRALLTPVHPRVPFWPMFASVMIGYATTWVTPGRLGEVVRPMLLSGKVGVPLGPCLGSVVVDRVLDAAAVMTLFVVAIWITPLSGPAAELADLARAGSVIMAIGVVVVLTVMLIASSRAEALAAWFDRRGRFLKRVGNFAVSASHGAAALRSPRQLILIVFHSLAVWSLITVATWLGVLAVGAEISLGTVALIMPVLMVGVAVPTPGGAGSYHAAMMFGLVQFGVPEVTAVSAGLLVHASITIPLILIAAILLATGWWQPLVESVRQVKHLGSSPTPRAQPGAEIKRVAESPS